MTLNYIIIKIYNLVQTNRDNKNNQSEQNISKNKIIDAIK